MNLLKPNAPVARIALTRWWRFCQWPATALALIALYGIGYRAVRTRHSATDGTVEISAGGRIADRIFAPAIWTERLFERRPPNAEQLVASAVAAAKSSDRKVILTFGTPSCLPCRQLERFLDEQKTILSRHFLIVKIEVEGSMLHGDAIQKRYRQEEGALAEVWYFPWLAVLDGDGKLLVTSDDGPKGVIGLPHGSPRDRAWFLHLLHIANPQITPSEIARLDAAALAFHNLIWRDVTDNR